MPYHGRLNAFNAKMNIYCIHVQLNDEDSFMTILTCPAALCQLWHVLSALSLH